MGRNREVSALAGHGQMRADDRATPEVRRRASAGRTPAADGVASTVDSSATAVAPAGRQAPQLTPAQLLGLQRSAGNRAIALTLQTPEPAAQRAGTEVEERPATEVSALADRATSLLRADPTDYSGRARQLLLGLDRTTRQAVIAQVKGRLSVPVLKQAAPVLDEIATAPVLGNGSTGRASGDGTAGTTPAVAGNIAAGSGQGPTAAKTGPTPEKSTARPVAQPTQSQVARSEDAAQPARRTEPPAAKAPNAKPAAKPRTARQPSGSGTRAATGPQGAQLDAAPPVEATTPALEIPLVAPTSDSPQVQGALDQVAATLEQRLSEITTVAKEQRAAIRADATSRREAVTASATALTGSITAAVIAAKAMVTADVTGQRTQIEQQRSQQKAAAQAAVTAEATRAAAQAGQLSASVRQAGQTAVISVRAHGEAEANRASTGVAGQAASARQQGHSRSASFHDEDPDRAAAQADAVRKVANNQAAEFDKSAGELATTARKQAREAADAIQPKANQVAAQIDRATTQARPQILGVGQSANGLVDLAADTALQTLTEIQSQALAQLDTIRTTGLAQAAAIHAETTAQIATTERAALDGVAQTEREGVGQLRATTADAQAGIATGGRRQSQLVAGVQSAITAQDEAATAAGQALTGIGAGGTERLGALITHAQQAAATLDQQLGGATGDVGQGVRTAAAQAGATAGQGMQTVVTQSRQAAAAAADELIKSLSKPADKTKSEITSSATSTRTGVTDLVSQGLAKNNEALTALGTSMAKAAVDAAEEYDRPWWKKALYALGKALLFLVVVLVVTLVLAAAIAFIASIAFATALVIAMVGIAVGFVIYEFINRLQAYRAEHGPVGSFWKALGISATLLGISIASLTGIPSIVEGIRGKRFFSDRQLSEQERYDLVIGGVLQLILLASGLRALRGRRAGGEVPIDPDAPNTGPKTDPGPGPKTDPNPGPKTDPTRPAQPTVVVGQEKLISDIKGSQKLAGRIAEQLPTVERPNAKPALEARLQELQARLTRLSAEADAAKTPGEVARIRAEREAAQTELEKLNSDVRAAQSRFPDSWKDYDASLHEEFQTKLKEFRGNEDLEPTPGLRGGEGQLFLSRKSPLLALKRWFKSRVTDMSESLRLLRSAKSAVEGNARLNKVMDVVEVAENGSDWAVRGFDPTSVPLRNAISDPAAATARAEALSALGGATDPVLVSLRGKLESSSANLHWSPANGKILVIDMQ